MKLKKQLGYRIRELRKAKALTQEQLAERSEIHYSYIGGVERGDRNISIETLERLAQALEVPAYELFLFNDDVNRERTARQNAIADLLALVSNRSMDEVYSLIRINKEIIAAIDNNSR